MRVPGYLEWLWARPDGAEWLERLPALVAACADQWELTLSAPFEDGGQVSYVAPATTPTAHRWS